MQCKKACENYFNINIKKNPENTYCFFSYKILLFEFVFNRGLDFSLSLRKHLFPIGEERGETDVFAGYFSL